MSDLFDKSIRTLELPAVLEKLAAKAVSQAAKDRCLKLTPSTDVEEVLRLRLLPKLCCRSWGPAARSSSVSGTPGA